MTRSDAVRQSVLERDGYRCQVCGFDGRAESDRSGLHVHHVRPLGMGGSDELDTPENCITLCANCHRDVHDGKRWIGAFDPTAHVFDWRDQMHKALPCEEIWYYIRDDVERGEAITMRLTAYAMIDRGVAKDAYDLRRVFKACDPDSPSFRAYLMARGINPGLDGAARLYKHSLDVGVEWPADMSAIDYRMLLKEAGIDEPREYLHLEFSTPLAELVSAGHVVPRWLTSDEFAENGAEGVKAGKLFRIRREGETLTDLAGRSIPVSVKGGE